MAKKKSSKEKWDRETKKLEHFCYEHGLEKDLVQLSTWHFRLKNKIDIWAGVKKYYVRGSGHAEIYKDIKELEKLI